MKIQHLRFLAAVVEHGGVVRAAEAMRVSQPAVSAGLHALEQELGQPLFERACVGRRIQLRRQAEQFHRRVLAILRACDAAKAEFTSASGNRRQFRLGIMPTLAAADIEAAIAGLREHCPELEIHIWEGNPERLAGWLKQGRIDVSWTQVGELEHGVDVLWQEPVVGLVAPGHPITRRQHPSLTIDDLRHEPFVWRQSCEIVASAREALNAAGVRLRVAARADREDVAMRLVAMNVGVAIAPRSLAVAGVTAVPLSGLRLGRTVGLRWAEGAEPGVRQDLLRVVLSLRASPLPATGPAGAVMPAGQVAASRRIRGRAARSQPK